MSEKLCIRNCNLLLPNELMPEQFQQLDTILITYDCEKESIMLSGPGHIGFKLSYPLAHQQIMKTRNLAGDRVISCHALFLDHELADEPNEELELKILQDGNILQISLPNHPTAP
ncbi:MAG: hypothetical protein L3J39_06960 [Verrucomicrobiales bacterium]|nr:hypothetical protein [Verrucomicrobiales bacterium]